MKIRSIQQLGLGLNLSTKRAHKREFIDQMERVVPWAALAQVVHPHDATHKTGRPPFSIETMLRIHYLHQWFALSDPAMEEALHDMPVFRDFAKLDAGTTRLPDETTILRFRHLLEKLDLANVNDVTRAGALLHGQGEKAWGDAGYQGVHKQAEAARPTWHVAMRPGTRRQLNPFS